jgi:DNA modification methylase
MTTTSGAIQPSLFDIPETGAEKAAFSDPAFASNKSVPVHRWIPWIAGFSREFVQGAIERHLKKRGTVLDPFAGVGTTLVEAILAGHDAVGFEINPYAALACRTKLTAYRLETDVMKRGVQDFQEFCAQNLRNGYTPQSTPPPGFKTRADFYSPKVLSKVLAVQDFIAKSEKSPLHDMYRLAFASTMVTYSNYSYEPSLGRRASAGREDIADFPVAETILSKLHEIAHDIEWLRSRLNRDNPTARVFNESFFTSAKKLEAGSVDLLITSPPYLNNYHYNRNTRPHLYWLGFAQAPSDFKTLEEENYGKFWQTVRERACVDLDFPCEDADIRDSLGLLRTKNPEKGIYGGNGWANYAASYFNDCYRFASAAKYALRRRGTALVVIGNSILQGVMIPTDKYLGSIAESVGLELVDIHIPRATRVGNSIIQSDVRVAKAKKSDTLYEAVVELRKR